MHHPEEKRRKGGERKGDGGEERENACTRPNDHVYEAAALWRGSRFRRGRQTVITVVHERSHRSTSRFAVFCSPSRFIFSFPCLSLKSLTLSLSLSSLLYLIDVFRFDFFPIIILFSCASLTRVCVLATINFFFIFSYLSRDISL